VLITEVANNLFAINASDIRAHGASGDEVARLQACFAQSGALIIEDVFDTHYIDELKHHFDARTRKKIL
jgi:hypothetical protein